MSLRDLLFTSDGREQLRDLLFGFDGRIGREKYWLACLAWIVIAILLFAIFFLIGWLPYLAIGFALIAAIIMINSSIAVSGKRLHDRGKSRWWLLLFYLGPGLLEIFGRGAGPNRIVFELASLAITVWMFVELGCLRGTAGPNKYGPDPLATPAEPLASTS